MLKALNETLAGEYLVWSQARPHLQWALDKLNDKLDTCFPDLTSTAAGTYTDDEVEDYPIPAKYIRAVLIPGAAHHFYLVDDEGTMSDMSFLQEMEEGMFKALRDFSPTIADEYFNYEAGSMKSQYGDWLGGRGIWL